MAEHKPSKQRKQPVIKHPLFPAIVALWIGALLGLGSLAVRPDQIESLVLATGLHMLVPAAAPPLGMTARILIALAMAGFGALIGALVARRMARPNSFVQTRPARGDAGEAPAKPKAANPDLNPLLVMEEVDEAGIAPDRKPETTPFSEAASEPAHPTEIAGDEAEFLAPDYQPGDNEPSLPRAFDAPAQTGRRFAPPPSPQSDFHTIEVAPAPADEPAPLETTPAAESDSPRPERFSPPGGTAAERIVSADVETLSNLQLIERLAIGIQRRMDRKAAEKWLPQSAITATPEPDEDPIILPALRAGTPHDAISQPEPAPLESAPLESANLESAMPETLTPILTLPPALRPLSLDDSDDAEALPSFAPPRYLSLNPHARLSDELESELDDPAALEDDDEDDDHSASDDGYSSLIDFSRPSPARQPPIRIEELAADDASADETVAIFPGQNPWSEPPVVTFPAPLPQSTGDDPNRDSHCFGPAAITGVDPEETERALRSALARLQRMSGAA